MSLTVRQLGQTLDHIIEDATQLKEYCSYTSPHPVPDLKLPTLLRRLAMLDYKLKFGLLGLAEKAMLG
jgi:hypothetical protein